MSKINKEECMRIIYDFRDNGINEWDWEDDYHRSGKESREERMAWTYDRLNAILNIIDEYDFNDL